MQWTVCVGKWNFGDSGGLVVCRVPTQPQRQPLLAAITHHALQGIEGSNMQSHSFKNLVI